MVRMPTNFDGEKFAKKFNLTVTDFWDDGAHNLICPSLPNLTDMDIADCVTSPLPAEYKFDKPLIAPDFIVQSPKPKTDPMLAHAEAIAEAAKADKSIALIVLDLIVYIEDLENRLKKKGI